MSDHRVPLTAYDKDGKRVVVGSCIPELLITNGGIEVRAHKVVYFDKHLELLGFPEPQQYGTNKNENGIPPISKITKKRTS